MSLLYIIRHGQASFGNEQYDQLSELGAAQARILGDFLRRCKVSFDHYFSGPKKRQTQTALITMGQMFTEGGIRQPIILDELSEYDAARIIKGYFEMEGLSGDLAIEKIRQTLKDPINFFRIFQRAVRLWFLGELLGEGLESREEFLERVIKGLSRIGAEVGADTKSVVFTSGGVIAALMQEAAGISDEPAFDLAWNIRNASISVVEHRRSGLRLLSFNSVAHFEIQADPRLITYR